MSGQVRNLKTVFLIESSKWENVIIYMNIRKTKFICEILCIDLFNYNLVLWHSTGKDKEKENS